MKNVVGQAFEQAQGGLAIDYNALGQVTASTQTTGGTPYSFGYTYTAAGSAADGDLSFSATLPLGNGLNELRCYNSRLQVSSVQLGTATGSACPTGGVLSLGYTYPSTQNNGNVSGITIAGAGLGGTISQTFGYDNGAPATGFNRLTSFTETGGAVNQNYSHDNFGNHWISSGYVNSSYAPQTPQSNNFTNNRWADGAGVVYDYAGNQTSVWLGGSNYRTFTYDAENRQITASIPGMSAISYLYDGDGRRVQKTVGSTVTTYIYDAQGDLAEELGGPANPLAGQTTYLTPDALGSTRAVTSSSGGVLARYDYAPYGEELNVGMDGRSAPFLNNFYPVPGSDGTDPKFTGQVRDPDTGLDFFNARYASFAQGRFTSPDGPFNDQDPSDPQSWNLYSYVRNNPLNATDPDGDAECVDTSSCSITVNGGAGVPVGYDPSRWRVQFGILNAVTSAVQAAAHMGQATLDFIQRTNWSCVSSATVAGASVGFGGGAGVGAVAGLGVGDKVTVPAGAVFGSIATGTTAFAGSFAWCSTGSGGATTGRGSSGGKGGYRVGQIIRKLVDTPSGRYEIEFKVESIEGDTIVVKHVNVFPEGGGTATPGVAALKGGIREVLEEFKEAGFSNVRITNTLRLGSES